MGDVIELSGNGTTGRGYLATPEQGAGPGVVVIQEYWGLVPHIEDVCDRLAGEGFAALAPDLFHGATASEPDEAGKLMMALNLGQAARDMGAAVDHLVASEAVRGAGVGVIGFCMGGGLALMLATERPDDVRACVAFYGLIPWESAHPEWSRLDAAVQGHFAEEDEFFSPDQARQLEQTLRDAGKDVEMFLYPGVGHAFFNDARPEAYDASAASTAWTRSLEFLRAKLG
ncbi:MAG: dienelactone hydrolase family protein [Actinobacteria bacterium]|nr:dienelactone hydrolase family protein [Actinomycetota bacterium]